MSLREALAGGGGVKSIQTGYVSVENIAATGTGEDTKSTDITISAVASTAKCVVTFDGLAATTATTATTFSASSGPATSRLTSTTNLRLSASVAAQDSFVGRWTVVEYK